MLATQEAEIRRIKVQGQPGAKSYRNPDDMVLSSQLLKQK
jgi:hypothetical protein